VDANVTIRGRGILSAYRQRENPLPNYSAGSCLAVIGIERTPIPYARRPSCREVGRTASGIGWTFGYRMAFSLADIPQNADGNTSIFQFVNSLHADVAPAGIRQAAPVSVVAH
jgi:hypothetical protein